jgi:hypothetical protein
MQRAYNELIKQVPLVITLVDHGDAEALAALYCNVYLSLRSTVLH